MLHPFRRHLKKCKKKSRHADCPCPIHYEGIFNGEYIRGSLDLTDFTAAYARLREWEISGMVGAVASKTITDACNTFLKDFKAKGRHMVTVGKYELLFDQLKKFAERENLKTLAAITYDHLVDFRHEWPEGALTKAKKCERLKSFFRLAHNAGWIRTNPAHALQAGDTKKEPEDPFSEDDLAAIDKALIEFDPTLNLFEKLLRFTGMRISDGVTLKASELVGNRVHMNAYKNKKRVSIPIPPWFADTMQKLPTKGGMYFWRGTTKKIETECDWWRDEMNKVFKKAEVVGGHCHRYRHTFICTALDNGCTLEQISSMTGTSVKILETHYLSYLKPFQEQLNQQMGKGWKPKLALVK